MIFLLSKIRIIKKAQNKKFINEIVFESWEIPHNPTKIVKKATKIC